MMTLDSIKQAQQRIAPYINKTPIVQSSLLNDWLGHRIYFKAECLQKIGAFKARSGCNAIAHLLEQGKQPKRIVANSSGNHAQAIAWAARQFNIPATIYMPSNVSKVKAQATASYGADIELLPTRDAVDTAVQNAAEDPDVYWIPPYNHNDVIAGQGTAAFEAVSELDNVDAVFAPCGGGGLISGSYIATKGLSPHTRVFGVEPLNANDAAESLRSGTIQSLKSAPDTLADGARTPSVGSITFEYLKQLDGFYEADEASIIYWTQWLTHLLKLTIEPTSAMTMFGVVEWLKTQSSAKEVVVILTGGNLDADSRRKLWQQDALDQLPSLNL